MIDPYVEAHLANELEGGLFVEFFMIASPYLSGSWSIEKHFYTVENGIVYEVGNGRHGATKDTLMSVKGTCQRVGDYDPSRTYEIKIREFTFEEMERLVETNAGTATELQPSSQNNEPPE